MPVPDPPPSYTPTQAPGSPSTNVDSAPPAYVFPSRYEVGGKVTERPLVDIASLKGHLALLNAFARLKEKVEAATFDRVLHVPQDGEAKWSWFVGLAAERFDRWCLSLSPKAALLPIEEVLPPLDVLMGLLRSGTRTCSTLAGTRKIGNASRRVRSSMLWEMYWEKSL
ncbi:hypothetical protein NMY22_g11767 [Coprinellus aureogranulatus]|nr:hypothetical protein NMY22_g11767 [Coprinellus aureogranulatus]